MKTKKHTSKKRVVKAWAVIEENGELFPYQETELDIFILKRRAIQERKRFVSLINYRKVVQVTITYDQK